MTVPFKVKAVYEYKSDEPDDLKFGNGQIITVTEDDDPDWYTGEYATTDGQKKEGLFPRNFVEKYEPVVPIRPTRAPRKPAQPDPVDAEATANVPEPAPPPAAIPPPAHEPAKEAEIEPPREFAEPGPALKVEAQPPASTMDSKPAAKKPPPVTEKPTTSSFKDRIAAFNKPAAAPVKPFKPAVSGGGTGFVKKPFVAPPPSRNAYVPPPRDLPAQKVYQREEELEAERMEPESEAHPQPAASEEPAADDDQPKPTSLKDRIALLQKQQLEQAQRHADHAKKDKLKRPAKTRTDSSEMHSELADESVQPERASGELARREVPGTEDALPLRRSVEETPVAPTPPLPSRELVSDTNDADDSGGADTEDARETSAEEERVNPRSVRSPPMAIKPEPSAEDEGERGTDTEEEEEEDPEVRRRRELRERMAKMSGGMGMMGMFGAGAAPAPKKARAPKDERPPELQEQEETARAPPVPIMALPGMSNIKQMPKPPHAPESEDEDETAQPTPMTAQDLEEDYISQKPSRKSTERSQPLSPQDRAPPPPPPPPPTTDRPEPPQTPGARPVPRPPPPSKMPSELPLARGIDEPDDEEEEVASLPPSARPLSIATNAAPRAVPPPPPAQSNSSTMDQTRASAPPVPMSPTSPQSRPPPPPPPGQPLSRRTTNDSSLHAAPKDDSDEEVTEYDGDYDTDIASNTKHKAALKSHNRDSSMDEGALSDDAPTSSLGPQSRAIPPIPSAAAPRDVPPPPPPSAAPKPRESFETPRVAPPPLPPQQPRGPPPQPRRSVDSPRTAPPPVPLSQSPREEQEYDPFRSSTYQPALPGMVASLRKPTEDFDNDETETSQLNYPPPLPMERAAPPLPPVERAAPPPPPTVAAPVYNESEPVSMSGILSAPKPSTELGRSNTTSRRSADVSRQINDQGFIASDIDLAQNSMWWTRDNNPPPTLQNRNDVLWEVESSTTQKRGGKSSVSRDIYILYQDYSQTTVNATFDAAEPTHVSFEQSHERPPMQPRKDQLESASTAYGAQIAKAAEKASGSTIGEGSAQEFVLSLIRPLNTALMPVGTRSYGALVYANLANASTQQFDEIRPGDIVTFRNAKFAGHKGGLHQKYSQDVGNHVGVVIDWDGTKKKIRAWEQGNQEKGKKAKIREESYRVADLKSGEVIVWRVMPRAYVNWGSS